MHLELVAVGSADVAAIHQLIRRWEDHWRVPNATAEAEIVERFDDPHFVAELDARGVWAGEQLVAYGTVVHTPSGSRQERVFIEGWVDPAARGTGIGRRLLAWQIERATEKLRMCDPAIPWNIRTGEWDWIDDAIRLQRRFGLEAVRWFEDMIRPLSAPLEAAPPAEVQIVEWAAVADDELLRLSNDAFADHWGSTPRDRNAWDHIMASSSIRRDLSYVATAGGRAVGYALNAHFADDEGVTGRREGWIESLGVAKDWRRQGIAAALIARSLEAFRAAGFTHAMIGVDTDNPSGAAGLYKGLGFESLHRTIISELRVTPA